MIRKKYCSMLLGATVSSLINALLIISDTFISAFFLGESAVMAINLVTPMYNLGLFIAMLLSLGIPVLYSGAMGRFNKDEADLVLGTGLGACLAGGLLLFILLTVFQPIYFEMYPASEELEKLAGDYYFWMRFELLLMPVTEVMVETVFADGDATCAVEVSVAEIVSNIAFSIILCRSMGIAGVAIGSFIAVVFRLLVSLTHLFKKTNSLHINFRYSFAILKRAVRIALVDAGNYLFIALCTVGLNVFVGWRFGEEYIIIVSVIMLVQEFMLLFDGIGVAISPIISVYLSEKCTPGVRKIWHYAMVTVLIEGFAVMLLVILMSGWIPDALGITDSVMARTITLGIRILTAGMVFICYLYLHTSYYRLREMIWISFAISAMRDVLVVVPTTIICGMLFGIPGCFIGVTAGAILAFILTMLFGYKKYGVDDFPLLLNELERDQNCYLYELKVVPDQVITTRDSIEKTLIKEGVNKKDIAKCMLAVEETLMLVYERNEGTKVSGECELEIANDKITVITRDNGVSLNVTDPEMDVSSFRAFIAPGIMSKWFRNGKHLMAMSFNRNYFEFVRTR